MSPEQICLFVMTIFGTGFSNARRPPAEEAQNLLSARTAVQAKAEKGILQQREETIQELLKIVKKKHQSISPDGGMVRAIRLLGKLRASEAVEDLLAIVDYRPLIVDDEIGYPVAYALIEIGKPASRKALLRLRTERNPLRRSLLLEVIKHVEGKPVAVFLIRSHLKQKISGIAKQNLQQALNELRVKTSNKNIAPFFDHYKPTWK